MSSTTGIQNLLVNVFRPVYRYEIPTGQSNSIFVPKIEVSNIDSYSGNTISVFTAAIGDANNNVYVGKLAGNDYTALKACSNVTAIGYGAGSNISNVSNSTFLGFQAGASALNVSSTVAIGANAAGNGSSNVRIGTATAGTETGNIVIGTSASSSTYSNTIVLGPGVTATQNYQFRVGSNLLYGDLSTNWLGVGTSTPYDSNNRMDVSGNLYVLGQQGINKVPVRTLDVNGDFRTADAFGTLDFNNGSFTVTAAFKRTLNSTNITQPIIQYGKASSSGNNGSTAVTIPVAYSNTSYVVQVTMQDSTASQMSADITASNAFTIYWAGAGAGTHAVAWTTFGT